MTDAKEYGLALFALAEESGRVEAILGDLKTICGVFRDTPEYKKLLDTPAIPKNERLALVNEAFTSVDEYALNTLKILCERRSARLFESVAEAFEAEYDRVRGIERVTAVTAVAMSDGQIAALTSKLEKITGKTVIVKNTVDPSILGGVKLRYMGIQLDGSIKTRLDSFSESLSNTVI